MLHHTKDVKGTAILGYVASVFLFALNPKDLGAIVSVRYEDVHYDRIKIFVNDRCEG